MYSKIYRVLATVIFVLIFCLHSNAVGADTKGDQLVITKADEFIDIDKGMTRFMFRVNNGASVEFYLGQKQNALKIVKKVTSFDVKSGLKIGGLMPGTKYFYKIVAQMDGQKVESQELSFTKLGITDTNKTAQWARKSVFYQIFIRAFADGDGDGVGDFKGLTQKFAYLKELGVDAIWLLPCFEAPSYHGYDTVDFYAIDSDYGTMQDFDNFMKAAHKNGIKVILDLAVNHTSEKHPWFLDVQKQDSKFRDYYMWADKFYDLKEAGPMGPAPWNFGGGENGDINDPEQYFYSTFGAALPDLNFRNYKLREEVKKIAKFWLQKGVDGFRLDAAKHIDDLDKEVTYNWWQEFNAYVKSINPNTFLVGENWTNTDEIAPFLGSLDSSFNFPLRDALVGLANGTEGDILAEVNSMHKKYSAYSKNFIDSTFLDNHDMNRVASELGGNKSKLRLAASLLLTLPGTPFIYYGEELGQLGAKPDENIREGMDWYATAKGNGMSYWNSDPINTKPNDGISVEEQVGKPDSLLSYYKILIKIRKANPVFFTDNYAIVKTVAGSYAYLVGDSILVIHNLENKFKKVTVDADGKELISGSIVKKCGSIDINPRGTLIIRYEKPHSAQKCAISIQFTADGPPDEIKAEAEEVQPVPLSLADKGLFAAVDEGNLAEAERLINEGANVNAKDEDGFPVLLMAVDNGCFDIVKLLVSKGADIDIKDSAGRTPLISASGKGYLELMALFIAKGADVNVKQTYHGYTALMNAVMAGNIDAVSLLIVNGAKVNLKRQDGSTAINDAKNINNPEILKLLENPSLAKNPLGQ